jgi:hypothetical protein
MSVIMRPTVRLAGNKLRCPGCLDNPREPVWLRPTAALGASRLTEPDFTEG